jgi:hypothetical protein
MTKSNSLKAELVMGYLGWGPVEWQGPVEWSGQPGGGRES